MKNENIEHTFCNNLLLLLKGSFGIACNANDFFNYASTDMVIIDPKYFEWVLLIFKKYKWDGLNACMVFISKRQPIQSIITENYNNAFTEIEKLNPKIYSTYSIN